MNGPPHRVDAEAEVFGDLFEGGSSVQFAGDGLGGDATVAADLLRSYRRRHPHA